MMKTILFFLIANGIYILFFLNMAMLGYFSLRWFSRRKSKDFHHRVQNIFLYFGSGLAIAIILTFFFNYYWVLNKWTLLYIYAIFNLTSLSILIYVKVLKKNRTETNSKLEEKSTFIDLDAKNLPELSNKSNFPISNEPEKKSMTIQISHNSLDVSRSKFKNYVKTFFLYAFSYLAIIMVFLPIILNTQFPSKDPYVWQGYLFQFIKKDQLPSFFYPSGYSIYLTLFLSNFPGTLSYEEIHSLIKYIPIIHLMLVFIISSVLSQKKGKMSKKPEKSFLQEIFIFAFGISTLFILRYFIYRSAILLPTGVVGIQIIIFLFSIEKWRTKISHFLILSSLILVHPLNSIFFIGIYTVFISFNILRELKNHQEIKKTYFDLLLIIATIGLLSFFLAINDNWFYSRENLRSLLSSYRFSEDILLNYSNIFNFILDRTEFLISISGYHYFILLPGIFLLIYKKKLTFSKLERFLTWIIVITGFIFILGEIVSPIAYHLGWFNFNLTYHIRLLEIGQLAQYLFYFNYFDQLYGLILTSISKIKTTLENQNFFQKLVNNIQLLSFSKNHKYYKIKQLFSVKTIRSVILIALLIINGMILILRPPIIDFHFSAEYDAFLYPIRELQDDYKITTNHSIDFYVDQADFDIFYLVRATFYDHEVKRIDLNLTIPQFADLVNSILDSGDLIGVTYVNPLFQDPNLVNEISNQTIVLYQNSQVIVFRKT